MTPEDAASYATVIGFPLLLIQLALSDRTRAASEMIDQLETVAMHVHTAARCERTEFDARVVMLINTLESIASLLNRWLMSIWSRRRWYKFLVDTLQGLDDDSKFTVKLRGALASSDYPSLRYFIRHNEDRFPRHKTLVQSASL